MYSSPNHSYGAVRRKSVRAQRSNRESAGGVRMSVLDVAMEIGLSGANNTLQDWIYNNQLVEEEEDFEPPKPIPGLTKEPSDSSHGSSPKTPSMTDASSTFSGIASSPRRTIKSTTAKISPMIFTPSTTVDPDNYHNSFFPPPPPEFNSHSLGPKLPQSKPILSKRPSRPKLKPSHVSIPGASFGSVPSLQLTMPSGAPAPKLETPFSASHDKSSFVVPFDDISTGAMTAFPDSPTSPQQLSPQNYFNVNPQSSSVTLQTTSSSASMSHLSAPEKHQSLEKKKTRWSRKSSKDKGGETDYETDGYISEGPAGKSTDKKLARKSLKLLKKSKSTANIQNNNDIDDGYLSSKSSKSLKAVSASAPSTPQKSSGSGFFWRRKSKRDEWEGPVPPLPSASPRPTPIAARFVASSDTKESLESTEALARPRNAPASPPRRRQQSFNTDPEDYSRAHRTSKPTSEPSSRSSAVSDDRMGSSPRFNRQAPPVLRMKPLNITKRTETVISPPKGRPNISLPVNRPTESELVSDLVASLDVSPATSRPEYQSESTSPSSFASMTPPMPYDDHVDVKMALQSNISTPRKHKKEKRTSSLAGGMGAKAALKPSTLTSPPPSAPLPKPPSLLLHTGPTSKYSLSSAPGSFVPRARIDEKPKHETAKGFNSGTAMYREITVFGDVIHPGVVVNRSSDEEGFNLDPMTISPVSESQGRENGDSLSMYDPAAGLENGLVSPNSDAIEFVKAAAGQYALPSPVDHTRWNSSDHEQLGSPVLSTTESYLRSPILSEEQQEDPLQASSERHSVRRKHDSDYIPPLESETVVQEKSIDERDQETRSPPRDYFRPNLVTVAAKRDYFEQEIAAISGASVAAPKRNFFRETTLPPKLPSTLIPPSTSFFEAPEDQKYDDDEVSPDIQPQPDDDDEPLSRESESAEMSDRPVLYPTEYLEDQYDDDDRSIYPPSARSPTFPDFSASLNDIVLDSSQSRSARNLRTTMYSNYTYEDGADPRFSRYSAAESDYSVLDAERSGEVRNRLIRRVEAISANNKYVPPVPRLPEQFKKKQF